MKIKNNHTRQFIIGCLSSLLLASSFSAISADNNQDTEGTSQLGSPIFLKKLSDVSRYNLEMTREDILVAHPRPFIIEEKIPFIPEYPLQPIPIDRCDFVADSQQGVNWRNRSSNFWQGFNHEWFATGHRVGDIGNYIKVHSASKANMLVDLDSTAYMTYKPGEDGDRGDVDTFYFPFAKPGIGMLHNKWNINFSDNTDVSRTDHQARTDYSNTFVINVNKEATQYGCMDDYEVVLRGFEMDITELDEFGNSTGDAHMWPTEFELKIENCTLDSSRENLECPVIITVEREKSSDIFKPNNMDSIEYDFTIYYTVVGGNEDEFKADQRGSVNAANRALSAGPNTIIATVDTGTQYDQAITGVTGFSWRLYSDLLKDGRYFDEISFSVKDGLFNATTGLKDVQFDIGLLNRGLFQAPATYDATLYTTQLKFNNTIYSSPSSLFNPLLVNNSAAQQRTKNADGEVCTEGLLIMITCLIPPFAPLTPSDSVSIDQVLEKNVW